MQLNADIGHKPATFLGAALAMLCLFSLLVSNLTLVLINQILLTWQYFAAVATETVLRALHTSRSAADKAHTD